MSKCLLISGGLDSACLWWIMDRPPALFIGGPHGPAREAALAEARAIERMAEISPEFADKLVVLNLDCTPFMRPGQWLFPRDEVSLLAAYGAGFDGVSLGWCADDGMTAEKAERASVRLRGAVPERFPFTVDFPGWMHTKRELVRLALEAGAPREFIDASYSCVTGSVACGECRNCKQREAALV